MQLSEAIRTYLNDQESWTALIGADSVWPELADQETGPPFVTYHIELRPDSELLDGPDTMIEASVDLTVVSKNYDEVFEIAELARTLLSYFKGLMAGVSGLQIESCSWIETIPGYVESRAAQLGLFGALVRFQIQYIPQ